MEYPAKVLLAWGEAISGDKAIREWLIRNGYPELGIFVFALHLKPDARRWLMDNGHPHLMGLVRGLEGEEEALAWLEDNGMHVLRRMAVAGGDREALKWLVDNGRRDLARLALKMWAVKMAIEERHNDPYQFAQD